MTPEQQAIYDEQMRQVAEQRARLGLPPLPPPDALGAPSAPPQDAPPAPEAAPPAQPPGPAPEPQASAVVPRDVPSMPPPIPIPERRETPTGPRTGGEKARAFLSGFVSPFTGRDVYRENLGRQAAAAERDYGDDLREYGIREQQRQRAVQERKGMLPVDPEILRFFGLPEGTTAAEYERWRNAGGGGLVRQREGAEASRGLLGEKMAGAKSLEELRQEGRLSLEDQRAAHRLEQIHAAGRYKKGSGGGAGASGGGLGLVSRVAGISVDEAREGLDDIANGQFTTDAAQSVMLASRDKDVARIVTQYRSVGGKERADIEGAESDIRKYYQSSADVRAGLSSWKAFEREHADEIDQYVSEIKSDPSGKSWSGGARDMLNAMRKPVASFLRKMAGAAMSPSEAGLHGGPAAQLLMDASAGSWGSIEGIADKISAYMSRTNARPEDLFALLDRVGAEADEQMKAVARSAPTAALATMPRQDATPIVQDRLREAVQSGDLQVPEGAKIAPSTLRVDGHRIRFQFIMPDGSRKDGAI